MVLDSLPPLVVVAILSIIPVSELRGAIFTGITAYDLPIVVVYAVAVGVNLLVAPLVYIFLDYFHQYFLHIPLYKKLFNSFIERARHRVEKKVQRYGYFGLTLFVAIPLPITGAYTGTAAAWLFDMNKKKTIASVSLGVFIAGIVVTIASLIGEGAWSFFVSPLFS